MERTADRRARWVAWHFTSLLAASLLTGATCGGSKRPQAAGGGEVVDAAPPAPASASQHDGPSFHIIAFGRTLGSIAPCGCTTEPLGGLPFAFGWLEKLAPPDARLVLEPGSFLFPEPGDPQAPTDEAGWAQAVQRAELLHARFGQLGAHFVAGLGPTDAASPLAHAAIERFALPRVLANATATQSPELPRPPSHRLVELSSEGVTWKVGVTAVVDPELPQAKTLGKLPAPAPILAKEVEAMRAAGAQFVVVMAHGNRSFAEQLASDVTGIDAVVVGVVQGIERERVGSAPARIGSTFILEPGEQLQTVTHLQLDLTRGVAQVPADDQWTVVPPKAVIERELARIDERLATFKNDPSADPAFLRQLEAERKRVADQLEGEVEGDVVATLQQVKITCQLPADAHAKEQLAQYDRSVSEANRARFEGVKPPPPRKGQAGYVGTDACADCHPEAVDFWKTTRHAGAYETLVRDNKQFDVACVGCHVTGFRRPGGSEVVENAGLVDVQCETCHGPGSLHADDGGDDLALIERDTPAALCAGECHTPEHSDTFEYVAYLRDVLGPGHGEARRVQLGDGPTGRELRAAGFAKAGGSCKKM